MDSAKIEEVCNILILARQNREQGNRRSNKQHYFSRIYEILDIGGVKKVVKKRSCNEDELTFIVPYEEFFEKLKDIHVSTGHGGRDKMIKALKPKYAIPRPAVEVFVKLCRTCDTKKQLPKKGVVVKPILSKSWNHRGQVDLIDLQSTPDGDYKWLLNFQDHLTKFVHLRPLKSKCASDVSSELLKIFLEFGAPSILQSDNGREFVNVIIKDLVSKWPSCKIINGRPRHPQSQGSVERSNQDVENMLRAWMSDNDSTSWSIGCYFVQWQKNASYHRIIRRTPYKALFGIDFQVGLFSSNLPNDVVKEINTEEELENMISECSQNVEEANHIEIEETPQSTDSTSKTTNDDIQIMNIDDIPIILNYEQDSVVNDTEFLEIADNMFLEEADNLPAVSNLYCLKCKMKNPFKQTVADGQKWMCNLCLNQEKIITERIDSAIGQKRAAEKMLETSNKRLQPLKIGRNVIIEVSKVDRGPLDPKNIIGSILFQGPHKVYKQMSL